MDKILKNKIKDKKSIEFVEFFNMTYTNYQSNLKKYSRKKSGIYYTNFLFAYNMIENMMESNDFKDKIHNYSFLEPCVGIGSFVFAYLVYVNENYNLIDSEKIELIKNIYVCDSDKNVLILYKKLLTQFCEKVLSINLPQNYDGNIGGALLYDLNDINSVKKIEIEKIFKISKFDFIITNPPYKLLRAELKHYDDSKSYEDDLRFYNQIKKNSKLHFNLQGKGTLNVYKLFVEEILMEYISDRGLIYLLIPQPFLKDQSSNLLRKEILLNSQLMHVINVDESSNITEGNQSLTAILISKKKLNLDEIEMVNSYTSKDENKVSLSIKSLLSNPDYKIIGHSNDDIELINKMNEYPKLKDLSFIKNLRGELDISLNKEYIDVKKGVNLIRGRNIKKYFLKDILESGDFVREEFIDKTKKTEYISDVRIASPQITNLKSKERLKFCLIPPGVVLANSCNFISVEKENNYNLDLYYLLGLFNSKYFDFYFKSFSSNNHINNHDIDNLPVPLSKVFIGIISRLSKLYLNTKTDVYLKEIDQEISLLFECENIYFYDILKQLSKMFPSIEVIDLKNFLLENINIKSLIEKYKLNKFDGKILEGTLLKYNVINNKEIPNDITYSLSELDLEMVETIPSGGNWKDIPPHIVEKSKRLQNIAAKGGRTTLYGRLNYSKPSYTITTYFSRPGNGTNIHPKFNRVITAREAARLQTFPDNYYFYGTKTSLLTQIGNAIPPIVSYQIAKKIKSKVQIDKSLDLFNGAGGLMYGFQLAGINSILINDIDERALITSKINNPEAEAFLGDISKTKNREYIIERAKAEKVDIVLGGPPCQGFSMAGYRKLDDERNELIYDYIKILKNVRPKVFLFENVQGLLSYNNGNTYKELTKLFQDLGYKIEMQLLDFSDYAVPQKRKRVIIIGVLKEETIEPIELFPDKITDKEEMKVSTFDAIVDIETNEMYPYKFENNTLLNQYFTNQISIEEYLNTIKSSNMKQLSLFS